MNYVIRHIEYLISRSDCVIVPGLGAILARRQAAFYDLDHNTMHAPRRIFAFNPSLQDSDATLAHSIAREKGISYDAAHNILATEVESMNRQLRLQGELPLGHIGNLVFNSETSVPEFHPYELDCLSSQTAWLPTLDLKQSTIEKTAPIILEAPIKHVSPIARFVRIAASMALLICLCFIASTPISINDAALASLTPQIKPTTVQDVMPPIEEPTVDFITIYTSHPQGIEMEIDDQPSMVTPSKKFCIVIGSFATLNDAEKYIKNQNKHGLAIFESQGRYRVYSSTFDNEADAYRALQQYPGAWVCRLN